jgi:hypothetical protein
MSASSQPTSSGPFFLLIPYHPVWAILITALSVFAIWALCSYDRDAARR